MDWPLPSRPWVQLTWGLHGHSQLVSRPSPHASDMMLSSVACPAAASRSTYSLLRQQLARLLHVSRSFDPNVRVMTETQLALLVRKHHYNTTDTQKHWSATLTYDQWGVTKRTDLMSTLDQLNRRTWNSLAHMLNNDDDDET